MLDALELQPGHRVLELAAGAGDVGFLAAELIAPGGTLICSDQSEAMIALARERAQARGLTNVEFRVINAESIDLPLASLDGVLCRWGYMLMIDPAAALRETRRVLRPGGRVALAVWDGVEANPWYGVSHAILVSRGLAEPVRTDEPGPFALGDRARLRELLEEAGFEEIELDSVDVVQEAADFDAWWELRLDTSALTAAALEQAGAAQAQSVAAAVAKALAPFTDSAGAVAVPGRVLVAGASA
jgi:ubiquinone/menaquinone biosynthesis C-methylase UbiE